MYDRPQILRLLKRANDPHNPDPEELREIIRQTFTIAVVGISRDPVKPARRVPSYLAAKGAEIIPVNPNATRILGKAARPSLDEVSEPVDMVLIFRPGPDAAPIIRAAATRPDRPVIWLQEDIRSDEAANAARREGLTVVQALCIFKVHRALDHTTSRFHAGEDPSTF